MAEVKIRQSAWFGCSYCGWRSDAPQAGKARSQAGFHRYWHKKDGTDHLVSIVRSPALFNADDPYQVIIPVEGSWQKSE